MATFNFYLDTKVTAWYRTPFEIEATSLDEAKEMAVKFIDDGNVHLEGWHLLDDTIEPMSVKQNGGRLTEELFSIDDNDEQFWNNWTEDYNK
jgi:hypothetical protein